jgi:hypothetical protein
MNRAERTGRRRGTISLEQGDAQKKTARAWGLFEWGEEETVDILAGRGGFVFGSMRNPWGITHGYSKSLSGCRGGVSRPSDSALALDIYVYYLKDSIAVSD